MRKSIIAFLLLSVLATSCQNTSNSASAEQVAKGTQIKQTIPADEFEKKIIALPGAQLIDVRTPEEFAEGHLKGAINIDVKNDAFEHEIAKLDKSKPVLVYCLAGGRSAKAADKMQDIGFKVIYNLNDGISGWKSAGKLVVTGK